MTTKEKKTEILVFISYATVDASLFKIREIAESLTAYKEIHDVLYWQADMKDNIFEYMNDNLGKCDVMLLFCSPHSMKSVPVKKEWTAADAMGKPIIPVFVKSEHIPPLLKSRLGIEFDTFDFEKNIQALYNLILKKSQKLDTVEPASLKKESSANRKKYNYFVNMGEDYLESKEYQEALDNFQQARKVSKELYDLNLTKEANSLIKQAKNLIKKEKEAKKKMERETEEKKRKEEEKARKEAQLHQIISFRNAQILQFEADILQEIEKLTNKQFITVNKIVDDIKMSFSTENQRVTGIGIYECRLSTLPESIGNLSLLKELYLFGNELLTLPESITKLTSLQLLHLDNNELSTLPESISNLASLKELSLSANQLTTLPESIGDLKSLKTLILAFNELSTLPESIINITSLEILDIDNNPLDSKAKSVLKQLKKNGVYI
ncbi:MAG: TIR domain-containing protein [Promethearchaeota archaeon]